LGANFGSTPELIRARAYWSLNSGFSSAGTSESFTRARVRDAGINSGAALLPMFALRGHCPVNADHSANMELITALFVAATDPGLCCARLPSMSASACGLGM
jgi:hypothetical protein